MPLCFVHFGGAAFTHGIEVHVLDGVEVRVYGVARTLADLFKFRGRFGLDVALEALRDAWGDEWVTIEELESAARVCRVQRVMHPYVEATVT